MQKLANCLNASSANKTRINDHVTNAHGDVIRYSRENNDFTFIANAESFTKASRTLAAVFSPRALVHTVSLGWISALVIRTPWPGHFRCWPMTRRYYVHFRLEKRPLSVTGPREVNADIWPATIPRHTITTYRPERNPTTTGPSENYNRSHFRIILPIYEWSEMNFYTNPNERHEHHRSQKPCTMIIQVGWFCQIRRLGWG